MESYGKGTAFLRQLSAGGGEDCNYNFCYKNGLAASAAEAAAAKKRVMVVIDHSRRAKCAMMWALTHVADRGDLLTLLHVVPAAAGDAPLLVNSLGALCRACKPEVKVEALVVQGPKLTTVVNQVRKLEASVLVLSQGKSSPLLCLMRSSSEKFVEDCINQAGCLTLAVKNQSRGIGGYLVSTRWQKNFWLLA